MWRSNLTCAAIKFVKAAAEKGRLSSARWMNCLSSVDPAISLRPPMDPFLALPSPLPTTSFYFIMGISRPAGRWMQRRSPAPLSNRTPDYPRLTDYDIAYDPESSGTLRAPAAAVAKNTGTPVRPALRFKYELRINKAYFEKNFREGGGRGAYSEYGYKDPIPIKYFRRVSEIAPTGVEPSARTASGSLTAKGPSSGPGGGSLDTADNEFYENEFDCAARRGDGARSGRGRPRGPPVAVVRGPELHHRDHRQRGDRRARHVGAVVEL